MPFSTMDIEASNVHLLRKVTTDQNLRESKIPTLFDLEVCYLLRQMHTLPQV